MKFKVLAHVFFCLLFLALFSAAVYANNLSSNANWSNYGPPPYARANELTSPSAFGWQPEMVAEKKISKRTEGLEIKGVVPEMTELLGKLQRPINDLITEAIDKKVVSARESKARSLTFKYTVYYARQVVSIVIESTTMTASAKTEVKSINFNPVTGTILNASAAIGSDVMPLAEKLIIEKIRKNPEQYNAGFDGLPGNQPFYLTNDEIVFLFNEFQLTPGADGVTYFPLTLSRIKSVTIRKSEYMVKPGYYNLKMIPLRQVCEGLGYQVAWFPEEVRVDISINRELIMELVVDANNYLVRDKKVRSLEVSPKVRSLESPPEIVDDIMYVPISFFGQILNLITYSVDSADNIIFLSYME